MAGIKVPVSMGELIDKITILRIKAKKISDPAKLKNVGAELAALTSVCEAAHLDLDHALVSDLESINLKLWQIEDEIRDKERCKEFDQTFIALARDVYKVNDQRFAVKAAINRAFGSQLHEEKSYQPY